MDLPEKITTGSVLKFVTGTVISLGTAAAVYAAFRVPIHSAKGLVKLSMKVGIFTLSCKAGDVAEKYFNETVDAITDAIIEARNTFRKNKKKEVKPCVAV